MPRPIPVTFRAAARPWALLALLLAGGCAHRLTAAQIAVLKQEGFAAKEEQWELGLADKMLFDSGSDQLKAPTRAAIEKTGAALTSVGIRNIRVEGHTDNVGADAFNQVLSQRRAAVVAAAMDRQGTAGRIGVAGFGKERPVADNGTEAGRAENRRVAVIVPDNQE